ncbi:MAG: 7,8-didemethyl-8-hydroxy-5-deazariboflavin synthase CofG [Acidimicrobiia bacterium]|nr:7,8-didemethyl-8-hydroxy-5-deazariboflavin synthase CofG [Acidimicrobiia bacterium]NNF10911.1 7,8-didemethyl-8-hydroxy-5-deazariboflavin synthase CofG [Acidimicrobiia bacterium]NNL71638.1 7,8-didemethyl-8-hydroxy-5-deazariboflavin synthase CofG [Acidimicrobiia bacterium]
MSHPVPDPELALEYATGARDAGPLFAEAGRLRDEGKGRTVTYSRKVFIPLTTLCNDTCSYCTFAKPPGAGGEYLEPDEVMTIARLGEQHGCTEALFTLGDRPEQRWPQARQFLAAHGHTTTMSYVQEMTEAVAAETSLFPHANPGLMDDEDLAALRPSNPSMGMMLENISPRLMDEGMPHHRAPDKAPGLRVATIEAAGRTRVPFTTGVLVGIGEGPEEVIESLFVLADLAATWGHIQEIIVQNFRAKADTPMRRSAEPTVDYFARVVAVARWIFGPEMNVQVPPNLTGRYEVYLEAGINDWGGVSPLTIDWVNPEQPWPHLAELEDRTRAAGFTLRPRLPVYPEFMTDEWLDPRMVDKVLGAVDSDGYALAPTVGAAG